MRGNDKDDVWGRVKIGIAESDESYLRRRAVEERAKALDALHPKVRQVHFDLAARYEDLARAIETFDRHLGNRLDAVA